MTKRATFNTYFSFDPETIRQIATAFRPVMAKHKIDTIVVRGTSGTLVGPAVTMLIPELNVFVIRKPNEESHNGERPVGVMGERWVFFDDFVDSGATFKAVYEGVNEAHSKFSWSFKDPFSGTPRYERKPWTPKFVGIYEYKHDAFHTKRGITMKRKRAEDIDSYAWRKMPTW